MDWETPTARSAFCFVAAAIAPHGVAQLPAFAATRSLMQRPLSSRSAPTITDVAERAGVSMKTVSRVLNDEPNVQQPMRDRVMAAVAELDYRPNVYARSLARSRSYLLGLLYFASSAAFIGALQRGATARCRELGYHLVVEPLEDDAQDVEQQLRHMISALRPDGLILAPPVCDNAAVLATLAETRMPCVLDLAWQPAARCGPGVDGRYAGRVRDDALPAGAGPPPHRFHRRRAAAGGGTPPARRLCGGTARCWPGAGRSARSRPATSASVPGWKAATGCSTWPTRQARSSPATTTWRWAPWWQRSGAGCRCRPTCRWRASTTRRWPRWCGHSDHGAPAAAEMAVAAVDRLVLGRQGQRRARAEPLPLLPAEVLPHHLVLAHELVERGSTAPSRR